MASEEKSVTIPKWNGKPETFPRYAEQIEVLALYYDLGKVMIKTEMSACPTKSVYNGLDKTSTDPNVIQQIKLYKGNNRLCAIFVLGQQSNLGLAAMKATKSIDHPQGVLWKAMEKLKTRHKPRDVTAEIELEAELKNIEFKGANDYYNEVLDVNSRFDTAKTDTELIKIMAAKVKSATYVNKILHHLRQPTANHSLEEMCNKIAKVQRLTKSTGKPKSDGKEVTLANAEANKGFKGKCNKCGQVGHKKKDCPQKQGGGENNSSKECTGCGRKGHTAENCWKTHPDKAPQWYKDKVGSNKSEAAGGSVEVMLASIPQDFA